MDVALPPPLPPPVPVRLTVLPSQACPYLPDRPSTLRAFMAGRIDGAVYHRFLDAGFRRSGRMVYQPVCDGCRRCVPIRVPTATFRPDKTQRRTARRNADLTVTAAPPVPTDEKFDLYQRYVAQWHGRPADTDGPGDDAADHGRAAFESFLYDSPVETVEFCYRDPAGRLLAVGIADLCPASLSSVYFYFDPDQRQRSLGTFGAVYEIAWASGRGIPHYHLGYWVHRCRKMEYKRNFRPSERLTIAGDWVDEWTKIDMVNFYSPSSVCVG